MREYANLSESYYAYAESILNESLGYDSKSGAYLFQDNLEDRYADAIFIMLYFRKYVLLRRRGNYILYPIKERLVSTVRNPEGNLKSLIYRVFKDYDLKAFWTFRLNHYLSSGDLQTALDECLERSWLNGDNILCISMMYPNNLSIHEITKPANL